jgi:hypothetical protein
MAKLLVIIGQYLLSSMIARLLTGAGLAILSATALTTLINTYFNGFNSVIGSFPPVVLGLAHISGLDTALSIIISAIIAKIAIRSISSSIIKNS